MFGGPDEFKNAPKQAVQCTKQECPGMEAAWYQVQIRSADEPMTTFYQVSLSIERGGVKADEEIVYDLF